MWLNWCCRIGVRIRSKYPRPPPNLYAKMRTYNCDVRQLVLSRTCVWVVQASRRYQPILGSGVRTCMGWSLELVSSYCLDAWQSLGLDRKDAKIDLDIESRRSPLTAGSTLTPHNERSTDLENITACHQYLQIDTKCLNCSQAGKEKETTSRTWQANICLPSSPKEQHRIFSHQGIKC